jgi:LDH2 family malate/lactate/ureidoglycolate dehydrogenase
VVGNFCMDLAIEKAKATGVGVVCAKRENSIYAPSDSLLKIHI